MNVTYEMERAGLLPEKWSLRYGFGPFGRLSDAEEEARA